MTDKSSKPVLSEISGRPAWQERGLFCDFSTNGACAARVSEACMCMRSDYQYAKTKVHGDHGVKMIELRGMVGNALARRRCDGGETFEGVSTSTVVALLHNTEPRLKNYHFEDVVRCVADALDRGPNWAARTFRGVRQNPQ